MIGKPVFVIFPLDLTKRMIEAGAFASRAAMERAAAGMDRRRMLGPTAREVR